MQLTLQLHSTCKEHQRYISSHVALQGALWPIDAALKRCIAIKKTALISLSVLYIVFIAYISQVIA